METPEQDPAPGDNNAREFAEHAEKKAANHGLGAELIAFLKYNKKWWLLPIIIVLLFIGLLVMLGSSALAPLIYPLF